MPTPKHRQVLFVLAGDPWDRWTNSGTPTTLIRGLRDRGLLWGALSRDTMNLSELHGRNHVRHFLGKVRRRLMGQRQLPPSDESPLSEFEGTWSKLVRQLPENSIVFYHYILPVMDHSLPINRFLFQDITIDDMKKANGYNINDLSPEEFARRRALIDTTVKKMDGIVSFASFVARTLKEQHGVDPSKVYPIGGGAMRSVDGNVPTDLERYKRRRILFVGRQWERKGGPVLLEAFRKVRKELPDATLTVVSSLAQFPPQEGVEHIKFASNQQLHELYKTCSVFTMPSICETWGLVYVEAAMHGLPTANWGNWALPDIVDNGVTGVLSDRYDADGLAEALIDSLRDPVRLQSMGRAAIQRARDVLAWPHVIDRLVYALVPEALNGREVKWMRPRLMS